MKFTLLALAVFVTLLAVLYDVDACGTDYTGTNYEWTFAVDKEVNVTVLGYVKTRVNYAWIKSGNEDSADHVTPVFIAYDYKNATASFRFIAPNQRDLPCLLLDTDQTFSQVKETIISINGTFVDNLREVRLDGTIEVTPEKVKELLESSWSYNTYCRKRNVFNTKEIAVDPAETSVTKKIKVIGLAAVYTITVIPNQS